MLESVIAELGVASVPLPGQKHSGDLHMVQSNSNGVLVGVIDALGHGGEAAAVAKIAVSHLENYAREPVCSLVRRCHQALIGTRGVVMNLASFDRTSHSMTWVGVGNILGVLLHAKEEATKPAGDSLIQGEGVVGYQLPPLKPCTFPVLKNDLLIFATDGIGRGFVPGLKIDSPAQQVADHILAKHFKGTDDGLVLVARYLGGT